MLNIFHLFNCNIIYNIFFYNIYKIDREFNYAKMMIII